MSNRRYLLLKSRDWLYQKYWIDGLCLHEIGNIVGCTEQAVWSAFKRLDIERRTPSEVGKKQVGKKNSFFGKHHSVKTKRRISNIRMGSHLSEATKRKISEAHKGRPCAEKTKRKIGISNKGKRCSEETKQKLRAARKRQKVTIKDTQPELAFIAIYRNICIADRIEDTRNNSFHIGRLNPDFIIRDMRIAIFVNGDYWHSPLLRYNMPDSARADFQKKICKKHKWKAIILWESDLRRKDAKAFVLSFFKKERIISFDVQ